MDKMNTIGNDIVTHYGPELPIKAVMFVDDDTGTGGITTADNTIIMKKRNYDSHGRS